jgi:predicted DNA-binding ribbon-helix-helix protein
VTIRKRSIVIAGHPTSVSLEDAFWDALADIARAEGRAVADIVTEVDARRAVTPASGPGNLSSALRVHILMWWRAQSRLVDPTTPPPPGDPLPSTDTPASRA